MELFSSLPSSREGLCGMLGFCREPWGASRELMVRFSLATSPLQVLALL
jgi:hypothetical protein